MRKYHRFIILSAIVIICMYLCVLYSASYEDKDVHIEKYKGLTTFITQYTVEDGDIQKSLEKLAEIHLDKSTGTIPEVTDPFVAKYTDCDTVTAYKKELKDTYAEPYEKNAERKAEVFLMRKIIANSKIVNYPQKEVDRYKNDIDAYYKKNSRSNGNLF